MTSGNGFTFFDANTLISFAVVDRIDILVGMFGGRAAWTEQVRREVRQQVTRDSRAARVEDAEWFGPPEEFDLPETLRIEQLRLAITGARKPSRTNLGEAQTLFAIENRYPGATFVTDDRHAADLAYRRGTPVLDACELLSDCYSRDTVGCPEAYDHLGVC